jgi:hypothetical protein
MRAMRCEANIVVANNEVDAGHPTKHMGCWEGCINVWTCGGVNDDLNGTYNCGWGNMGYMTWGRFGVVAQGNTWVAQLSVSLVMT